jgi:integrase
VSNDPVSDAKIPRGLPMAETESYTLDELAAMLKVVPEPGRTAVLVAGLSGLRISEIKGLRWEDYDGNVLNVRRSVWQGKVSDTKTLTSRAAVPVVGPVRDALAAHRKRTPGNGYIFAGGTGNPLRLENDLRRYMKPAMDKAGIQWKGWHGFRRGVGTILNQLGVDSKTIQTILRHANVTTTETFYVKPVEAEAVKAMKRLAAAFKKATM